MAKAKRAKKSKMPKKLLIVPALVIGVGAATFGANSNIGNNTTSIIGSNVESYEANDFVKEIFTKDNAKYVPIIFNNHEETLTKGDLINEFKSRGLTIKSISPDADRIVNGTKVTTSDNNTYTIIIYGDVDGNGTVNVRDVQKIIQHLLYGNGYTLTGVSALAANLENVKAGEINVRDAQKIISFIVSNNKIVDDVPTSDIANDNEKPVIHITGDNTVTINVFAGYDLNAGVTVTDNLQYLDPNIKSRLEINKGNFDPNKPGTYTITYNVSDLKGNKAVPVTRTIKVVDYIKELEIEKASSFKTEYTDGEKISLDGLKVYEVLAYAGKQSAAIDNNKIAVTPDKADINNQKFTISYGGMSKVIEISVTKNVPIITLNAYENEDANGTALIKCGTPYVEPGFKAVDKYDGTYIYPDTNPGNKFTVNRVITDSEGNVLTEIDGNTVGEYTVTYTVTNSQGNPSVKRRKVKIVDYITSARIDVTGVTKTDYVDGDTLSFEGIKVYVKKASNPVSEVEMPLTLSSDLENNIVLYDRVLNDNKNRNVEISCNVFDGVSEDILCKAIININVTKKFETVKNIINVPNDVEIYKETKIATLESGLDEAPIDINKLNVVIENPDTNEIGDRTYVKVVPVDERYVDVMLVAVAVHTTDKPYIITITPPAGEKEKLSISVVTKENNNLNYIDIGDLKTKDGKEVGRFKAGDTVVADLKFYHNYEYVNEAGNNRIIPVDLGAVPARQLKDVKVVNKVTEGDTLPTPVAGISAYFVSGDQVGVSSTNLPNAPVDKIQIQAETSVAATKDGLPIQIEVTDKSGEYTYINKFVDNQPLMIYAASKDVMELGNTSNEVTLSLAELSGLTNEGYEVRSIYNNYYTILPVSLYEELYREDGPKDVFANDFSMSITNKLNEDMAATYIDFVGIAKDGRTVVDKTDEDIALSAIGIAIADIPGVDNEEDRLEGGNISVSYGTLTDVKNMEIKIRRQSISSLISTAISNKGECYDDVTLATLVSGPRQQALDATDTIGFEVTRKATQVDDAKSWDIQATKLNSDTDEKEGNNSLGEVGISSKVNEGIGTVKFWAKQAGTYEVTPYVIVGNSKVPAREALTVTISENTDVTGMKLYYNKNIQNEYANGTDAGKIGINLDINIKQKYAAVFEHDYYRKGILVESRPITNVNYDRIGIDIANNNDYSSQLTVNLVAGSLIIPTDGTSNISGADHKFPVDALQLVVTKPETAIANKTAEFTVEVTNKNGTNYTKTVKATIGQEATPDTIEVGSDVESSTSTSVENIDLYLKKPNDVANVWEDPATKVCYTLVPIRGVYGIGANETEIAISASKVRDTIQLVDAEGKIAFVDNVNESSAEEDIPSGACILVKAFYATDKVNYSDIKEAKGASQTNYIGIAINPDKLVHIEDKQPTDPSIWDPEWDGEWRKLERIQVYFYPYGGGTTETVHTFKVNLPERNKTN